MSDVIVYYDGECPLCSREIAHYRAWSRGMPISYVDISASDFDAPACCLDPARVRRILHVRVGGELRTGIDAVIAMWQAIPAMRWLARLMSLPGVYRMADIGYRIFARFRPYLQRGRRCTADVCK